MRVFCELGLGFCGDAFDGAALVFEGCDEVDSLRVGEGVGVDYVADFGGEVHEGEDFVLRERPGGGFGLGFLGDWISSWISLRVSCRDRTFGRGVEKSDSESETSSSERAYLTCVLLRLE